MIFWIAFGICLWAILQNSIQVFLLWANWKNHKKELPEELPLVSVLIAVRNEEKELARLVQSLNEIDYPADKIEFLLADDGSEDQTFILLQEWAGSESNKKVIRLGKEEFGKFHSNGKANALALLSEIAQGEYYFFTDGDCDVAGSWIKEGISCFHAKTGVLIGTTKVRNGDFLAQMQGLDWWETLGIVKIVTDLGLPTTGLGNNMVISKEAYQKSGGFQNLPDSLTEDLEISKAIRQAGFKIQQQVSSEILVRTKAEYSWKALLEQRKRWVRGAMTLSLSWKILLALQVLFFPAIIWLIFENYAIGIRLWIFKIVMQGIFIVFFAKKAKQGISVLHLFLYDFYQIVSYSLTILYYFWPSQVNWKARKYP